MRILALVAVAFIVSALFSAFYGPSGNAAAIVACGVIGWHWSEIWPE